MASFTDQILQSRPYVQQLPLEAMAQVGMYKQQKYEEGVQKIQSQIDKIAGLDVIRGADRGYLQSKLNELGSKLKNVAAGDFSNFQLVNSVGGMAGQIANDPTVKSAVNSTAWYRKQRELIQKDIQEGKSDPANVDNFEKYANVWLNSTKAGESFSKEYMPHFDVFKFTKETFDAVQPDGYTFDQIFQLDKNGRPVTIKSKDKNGKEIETPVYSTTMTRLEREGRFPKKVQETLQQVFSDPRVSRQLGITGEYNYKNYDETALVKKLQDQKEDTRSALEDRLLDLNARRTNGEDVQKDIDAVTERLNSLDVNYNSYIEQAKKNPDQVRANLYKEQVFDRYTTMFGKISTKQQNMENAAWRAQFEMQKEANAQSRWAQTESRERWEFKEEQEFKDKQLAQAWNIAVLNASTKGAGKSGAAKGLGLPEDLSRYEQGNQFSDIDVIQLQAKDYQDAADSFTKSSADFIWDNSGFSNIQGNKDRLNKLISSGKSPAEAKYTILSELAKRRNVPVEDFMTQYVNSATKNYNNLSNEQKAKNPSAADAYRNFVNSEKAFKTQRAISENIDKEQAARFGPTSKEANKQLKGVLDNVKEQTVKIGGTKYNITKDDVYDLGLWLKGNLSVLGTAGGVDESMRAAANEAAKRLESRGKGDLISAVRQNNLGRRAYRGGPITAVSDAVRSGFGLIPAIKDITVGIDDYYGTLFQDVDKVFNVVDKKDFVESYKGRADVIRRAYNIQPNLKTAVFTGDAETDRQLLYDVKRWAGEYGTETGGKINASGDFGEFRKSLAEVSDPSKITLSAQPKVTDGKVSVEIVAFGEGSERIGGMTIQPDEAMSIGIDVNNLYESREVAGLRNYINYNKGVTSAGDPMLKETYVQGDAYFNPNDFPQLQNSGYSAMGNVVFQNGKYYPIVYVNDGRSRSEIRQLPGSPSLSAAVSALTQIKPVAAEAVLNKY
jgi:hypothetical protein